MTSMRKGRPAGGDGRNRERILDTARRQFGARGYAGTTIRSVAQESGFDLALVVHYFGKKEDLLTASLQLPEGARTMIPDVFTAPRPEQGERLTRNYLSLWEQPETSEQMRALARAGLGGERVADVVITMLQQLTEAPVSVDLLAGRQTSFKLAMAHLLGAAIARYVIYVPDLVALAFDDFVARISPAIQLHLDA